MRNRAIETKECKGRPTSILGAILTIALFAAVFGLLQRLTFALRFLPFDRSTIWTPGALVFAALLLTSPRRWWQFYVGLLLGLTVGFYGETHIPVPMTLLAAQPNFVGVAFGAWAVRRFGGSRPFSSLTSLLIFLPFALLIVPVITTAPVDALRFLAGAPDFWPVALRSVLCIALGLLIATPAFTLAVAEGRTWFRTDLWPRHLEFACLTMGLAAVGVAGFAGPTGTTASPALLYAPLPILVWAALRFGLAGASWALLLLAIQSTWAAIHGRGPFTSQEPAENVLQIQLFLLTMSLPVMCLAAMMQEHRRDLLALSQSEERFRLVVESTPSAILIANAEGTIVLVNVQCEKLFDYRRDELIGRPVDVLVPDRFRADHSALRARPVGASHELFGRRRDSSEFPVEIGLTPIQTGAGILVLYGITDLTARRQYEEARQELAHASRLALVGELTASIAHEINQPLGAILSNADAAEMLLEASPASLDEVRQILDDIRKDDLRASEVIRRLRTLLRKREMEVQPVDLNEVTVETISLVRVEARRRGVAIESDLASDLPLVRGNRVHLQQVLLNLFLNGIEAMAESTGVKQITVRSRIADPGCVELAVTDTGAGIPADQLPRLFEPFFSTKGQGMGLGLSIARSLIEAHGGRIGAENDPAGGATFRFTVPTGTERPSPVSAPPQISIVEMPK